jgi:hypothetical protein
MISERWKSSFWMGRAGGSISFAFRLKHSRYIRVSVVKGETVESLVRNLAEHLDSWGGVSFVVCVRPAQDGGSALGKKRRGDGMEPNLCLRNPGDGGWGGNMLALSAPGKRNRRESGGLREVFLLQGTALSGQRRSQQQLLEWHQEVNEERPRRATGVVPAKRLIQEAARLVR